MKNIDDRIEEYEQNIKDLTEYLILKVKVKDWHAVADAAMDIREIEAKIKVLKELQ
jgi:hypothetical protein